MKRLTAEGCETRRRKLIESANVDYIILTNPRHLQYFTGIYISQMALSGYGINYLTIDTKTGNTSLIVNGWLRGEKPFAHVDEFIPYAWYDGVQAGVPIHAEALKVLNKHIPDLMGKRVGIEIGQLPLGVNVSNAQLVDLTETILTMRRRKDPDELDLIHEAIAVCEAGHHAAREILQPGLSELDFYAAIHAAMVKAHGGPVHLIGDFAGDVRATGGPPTNYVVGAGEQIILDLSPIVNGYRADFTVTLAVSKRLNDVQHRLQDALHAAMHEGASNLKPGMRASDVYHTIYRIIKDFGFTEENIRHHAGHGLGLSHPEAPYFVSESTEYLEAGDIVTLEPGAYGDGFGARIEHNFLIVKAGCERLSNHNTSFT